MSCAKTKLFFLTILVSTLICSVFIIPHFSSAQTASNVTLSAFILENKNRALLNGDYSVRFALYTQGEGGTPVWQESQTITIKNGSLRASLGQSTPLNALDVQNTTYHLGITLNDDSEMSPRVAIGSAFSALNAQTLQGHTVGTEEGNLAILDPNAKFNKKLIPKLTKLGTVTIGTWEGEKITPSFLTSTFPYLAIGDGTPSSIDESNDLYVTDDLEVDGTIFGTFSGTVATGFTQGSVVFTDATGSLAQDNANFFWDDTNNRLGVGDATPLSMFTVGNGDLFQINSSGAIASATGITSSGTIAFSGLSNGFVKTSGGAGTLSISSTVALGSEVSGTLGVTNGGTGTATQFTQGSVVFAGASGVYSQNNANFFWDDTNNRLGIGTSAPTSSLQILSATEQLRLGYDDFNYWSDAIQYDGDRTLTAFGDFANFTIDFSNATDGYQFIIDPTGSYDFIVDTYANKVGINAGSPSATLDIYSIANASTDTAVDVDLSNSLPYLGIITGVDVVVWNNTSAGTTADIRGVSSRIDNTDNAGTTLTNAASFVSEISNSLSGGGGETWSSAYGVKIADWYNEGTITNSYGVYVGDITMGTQTNTPFSFYASDANAYNYFAGNLGIGDASPAALLTVGSGDLFQVNSSGAIASVVGITSSSNYVQSVGTFSLTSANTTQTTTSSALALNVNSLTTGTGLYAASSTLTSGKLVDLQISGTAAAASQTALDILTAGANATSGITTYGAQISNTHTNATSGTNVALYLNASGATTANYGLIVNAGNVGVGTTSPSGRLHVADTSGNLPFYVTSNIGDGTGVLAKFDRTTTSEVFTIKAASGITLQSSANLLLLNGSGQGAGIDATYGFLGVKDTTPDALFEASLNGLSTFDAFQISSDAANDGDIFKITNYISDGGRVGIGTTSPAGKLHVAGNVSASAWGTAGIQYQGASATFTDSSTAASGTATNAVFTSLAQPTLAASNTGVTTTYASTLYVANAPTAGTNQTISNAYSLWVDDGTARFDGKVGIGTSAPSFDLEVVNGSANATFMLDSNTASDSVFRFREGGSSRFVVGNEGSSDSFRIGSGTSLDTVANIALTIDSTLNVGIGTTSPSSLIDIAASNTTSALEVTQSSTGYIAQFNDGSDEVLRIDDGGEIVIGDKSTSASSWASSYDGSQEEIIALAVYNGKLYAGQGSGAGDGDVLVYDGSSWTTSYDGSQEAIRSLAVYNGKLYAGQGDGTGDGDVLVYDGSSWTTSYDGAQENILALAVYEGKLYAGQGDSVGDGDIFVFDGTSWTTAYDGGLYSIRSIVAFASAIYAGIGGVANGHGDIIYSETGTSWATGLDSTDTDATLSMAVYNGNIYAGEGWEGTTDGNIRACNSLYHDRQCNDIGYWFRFYDGTYDRIPSLAVYNGKLYAGASIATGMGDVLVFDGALSTIGVTTSYNGAQEQISALAVYNGKLYAGQGTGTGDGDVLVMTEATNQSYPLQFSIGSGASQKIGSLWFEDEDQYGTSGSAGADVGVFKMSHSLITTAGAYDVAEDYPTKDSALSAGDLVALDPDNPGYVVKATKENEHLLLGTVSTRPGFRLSQQNDTGDSMVPIALLGRVPVKVRIENGNEIVIGDALTISGVSGIATKATGGEVTIGRALAQFSAINETDICQDAFTGESFSCGTIPVFVTSQSNLNGQQMVASNEQAGDQQILTTLQAQMDMIREENKTITDFFLALNPDTLLYKDSLGNIDLGEGTLTATGVETGILTITLTDASAPTIGTTTILAGETSVSVATTAVGDGSKIYVTPTTSTLGQVPYVDAITDGEKFDITIDTAIEDDLTLNWWIVEAKE